MASQLSDNEKQRLFNHKATLLKTLITFSELPDYQKRIKQLETDKNIQQYLALMTALDKYNDDLWSELTFGDTPFEKFVWSITRYVERPYQLTAIQKAVFVLQEIRQQGIKSTGIPVFLQQSEQYNPLTKQAFEWDSDKQQIIISTTEGQVYHLPL